MHLLIKKKREKKISYHRNLKQYELYISEFYFAAKTREYAKSACNLNFYDKLDLIKSLIFV